MRKATWGWLAAGIAAAAAIAAVVYEERKKPAGTTLTAPGATNTGGLHLQPVRVNPNGYGVRNLTLNDGDTLRTLSAASGEIVNISLPINAFVVSASYGTVAWGVGAASGSKIVSVQLKGPTTIEITWNDPDVPANYTTKVTVTT